MFGKVVMAHVSVFVLVKSSEYFEHLGLGFEHLVFNFLNELFASSSLETFALFLRDFEIVLSFDRRGWDRRDETFTRRRGSFFRV
jgi:hypothetical protein